jgi:hypothetical protein
VSPSEPLSPADISSLHAEQGSIHVHVGGTAIFDGKPPGYEELLAHVDQRLNLIPRFRQRVRHVPGQVARPVWEDDPDFDLRRHVRHSSLPQPGSDQQLQELVGRIMSEPLDLQRPLWSRASTASVSRRSQRPTTRSLTASPRSMSAPSSSTPTQRARTSACLVNPGSRTPLAPTR